MFRPVIFFLIFPLYQESTAFFLFFFDVQKFFFFTFKNINLLFLWQRSFANELEKNTPNAFTKKKSTSLLEF